MSDPKDTRARLAARAIEPILQSLGCNTSQCAIIIGTLIAAGAGAQRRASAGDTGAASFIAACDDLVAGVLKLADSAAVGVSVPDAPNMPGGDA